MTEVEKLLYKLHTGIISCTIDAMYKISSIKEFHDLLTAYRKTILSVFEEKVITSDSELLYAEALVSYFNNICINTNRIESCILVKYVAEDEELDKVEFNKEELKAKKEILESLFISDLPIQTDINTSQFFLVCMENSKYKARVIESSEVLTDMDVVKVPIGYKSQAENNFKKFYEFINYIPTAPLV
jgi:hypothetical protein